MFWKSDFEFWLHKKVFDCFYEFESIEQIKEKIFEKIIILGKQTLIKSRFCLDTNEFFSIDLVKSLVLKSSLISKELWIFWQTSFGQKLFSHKIMWKNFFSSKIISSKSLEILKFIWTFSFKPSIIFKHEHFFRRKFF